MLMGENGKVVTENLKAQLERVRSALPDDVIVEVVVALERVGPIRRAAATVEHSKPRILMGIVSG